ncbi:hypothetical protein D1AOALGA4SA_9305 [Olavius algarvensis Delta 1 endosymbiont]|nr:hypothetical protein D1AOALGA4SA_9305 [Olavius algarvensis Delta 1 endosymbiont]
MRSLLEFFKTTLLGGLFVLLPLILLYLLLAEMLQLVVVLATPIADLFPAGTFDRINAPVLIAVILIVGASFIFGLTLRSMSLRRFGGWIERTVLGRLPLYAAVKSLSRGLIGAKEDAAFRPALLNSPDGEQEIIYVIEEHADGRATVLVPWAPASFAGSVKIISRERIEMLDASLVDTSRVLSHWGMGAVELVGKDDDTSM